jgi:hypothetical protein
MILTRDVWVKGDPSAQEQCRQAIPHNVPSCPIAVAIITRGQRMVRVNGRDGQGIDVDAALGKAEDSKQ